MPYVSSTIGFIHVILALAAMLSGALVLIRVKGDRTHKILGYIYVSTMIAMNISALFIHTLYRFGPFHILALFSLATVLSGIAAPLLRARWPFWLKLHLDLMVWSYAGLIAAFFAETITRSAGGSSFGGFWWLVIGTTAFVFAVTVPLLNRSRKRYLSA